MGSTVPVWCVHVVFLFVKRGVVSCGGYAASDIAWDSWHAVTRVVLLLRFLIVVRRGDVLSPTCVAAIGYNGKVGVLVACASGYECSVLSVKRKLHLRRWKPNSASPSIPAIFLLASAVCRRVRRGRRCQTSWPCALCSCIAYACVHTDLLAFSAARYERMRRSCRHVRCVPGRVAGCRSSRFAIIWRALCSLHCRGDGGACADLRRNFLKCFRSERATFGCG